MAAHPTAEFSTLVIDGTDDDRALEGIGTVLLPEDLGIDMSTIRLMQTIYDVMEYATALKPALLMRLMRRGARSATYFDPDIRIYGDLTDVFERAEADGIVLTPHTVEPMPRDGRHLNEAAIMHAGMYNLGFIATGPAAYRFLTWWHERLTVDAVVDLPNALFTDQRWIDWAPAIGRPTVLHDKGLNAAYWNVHERPLTRDTNGAWMAGGAPLRFFHFSGYDPATPWILSKHQGQKPRNLFSEAPGLRALCDAYGQELVDVGHVQLRRQRYRHDTLPSGLRLSPAVRRLCRDELVHGDAAPVPPPDPWTDPEAFASWLFDPSVQAGPLQFSRFEDGLWRTRPDLQAAFPDHLGGHAPQFREWLDTSPDAAGQYEALGGDSHRRPLPPSARSSDPWHAGTGWSVVSYARAELGVGEAGRRVAKSLAYTGLPWETVGVTLGSLSRQQHDFKGRLATRPGYPNTIVCANADQTPRLATMLELERSRARGRTIGYWFWELETFPERFRDAFRFVDEVWVASEFTEAAVSAVTDLPVRTVPLPVRVPSSSTRFTRRSLGMPEDKSVFLVSFDYLSVLERKNPLGAIEAYKQAFAPGEGTCLVVKSINGEHRPLDRERVRLAAEGRSDILLMEQYVSSQQSVAMVELADCVVSLHRAEGYGLNLVDAMARRTPVIATAYSGNMTFMDHQSAFLVPFTMREVGPDAAPYDRDAVWADPDLDHAARSMRQIVDDRHLVADVIANAVSRMEDLAPERLAPRLRSLLTDEALPGTVDGSTR